MLYVRESDRKHARHPFQEMDVPAAACHGPNRTQTCPGTIFGLQIGPINLPAQALFSRVRLWGLQERQLVDATVFVFPQRDAPLIDASNSTIDALLHQMENKNRQ